jgi:hypothetical protein
MIREMQNLQETSEVERPNMSWAADLEISKIKRVAATAKTGSRRSS